MDYINWRGEKISKFVLGTAQLGMDYGIANKNGKPSNSESIKILKDAKKNGINCFDTAQAYGNSETVLGDYFHNFEPEMQPLIITKLDPDLDPECENAISQKIDSSLKRCSQKRLWCLMLHRAEWLKYWDIILGKTLSENKKEGKIKYIGVSVYSVEEAFNALDNPDIDIIQIPCNAWDQRMLTRGVLEKAKKKDKLCFVRSVFLQGLLLMTALQVKTKLSHVAGIMEQWIAMALNDNLSQKQMAMKFGLFLNTPLVLGIETVTQLCENIELFKEPAMSIELVRKIYSNLNPMLTENIINPVCWREQ